MVIKNKCSAKKTVYKRLIGEKATISKTKELGLDPDIIDKMISLYRDEVEFYKSAYSE